MILAYLCSLHSQVLEEKPGSAVDLLETTLLVKKTDFVGKESSPLVPISVSLSPFSVSEVLIGTQCCVCSLPPMLRGPWLLTLCLGELESSQSPGCQGQGIDSHSLLHAATLTCQLIPILESL